MRIDSSARFYEMMTIAVPDGTPEELIETTDAIAGYITAADGRILRSSNDSPWGRRRLAYPIRHNSADLRDGFYTLFHFEIEPNRIEDLERELRLNERVIRHLLLMLDSEPIFVEEEEETEAVVDPETGETVVAEDTVTVATDREAGEVAVVEEVEVAAVDADGAVEAVADEVEETVVEEVQETVTEEK
ncbi:MAG: 30S ribosomal protein S6 [Thermomicrobiales bacterium]|nr:30S ribosomal protein S6 [Thermomicrobiales bacterium]